jgi:hypothetical protein
MSNYQIIFGVREFPHPRGEGYLYYKIVPLKGEVQKERPLKRMRDRIDYFLKDGGEKFLSYLNLYCTESVEIEEEKLEKLFRKAVVKLSEKEGFSNKEIKSLLSNYKTENMEAWVIVVLDRIVKRFIDSE